MEIFEIIAFKEYIHKEDYDSAN